jgi:hypothetical protein
MTLMNDYQPEQLTHACVPPLPGALLGLLHMRRWCQWLTARSTGSARLQCPGQLLLQVPRAASMQGVNMYGALCGDHW